MEWTIRPYVAYREAEILALYESVGWTNDTSDPEMLRAAFRGSWCTLGADRGDRLVGILRAVGDGASVVFVQDLLVAPDCQRQGIGTRLLQTLMERCSGVYQLELLTDDTPGNVSFYRAAGLVPADALGCRAMIRMRG